ncbi:MAG: adenylate/guanylate cyclase domain-containing protein [Phycisphaerae bacterium]|nr:adenylate/guanylate cyclase domain-containing protein [Phycisphaerae bacterium]
MLAHRPRLNGILTGLAVTILCTVWFFGINPEDEVELVAFDCRVRECNALEPIPPIVHVDIDDSAIERVGRWPWRRDQLADLIRTLHEVGAKVIAVDLLLSDPQAPFVTDPRYTSDSDVEPDVEVVGKLSEENVILGDLELAEAIRTSGNVFLSVHLDVRAPGQLDSDRDRLRALWRRKGTVTQDDARRELALKDTPELREYVSKELLRLRMADLLREDFTRTDRQLAGSLDEDLGKVVAVVAGVKSEVAVELVGGFFTSGATPELDVVLDAILREQKDRDNADRRDVLAAYRRHLGLALLRKATHPLDAARAGRFSRATRADPPHFLLAESARDVGVVNFRKDVGGGTRRVPLIVNYGGRALKHLGLAVACYVLGLDADHITVSDDNVLTIPRLDGSEPYAVPLDDDGNLIINWTKTAKDWRDFKDFPHISAAKVWAIVDARRRMESNNVAIAYAYADVVTISRGEAQTSVDAPEGTSMTTIRGDDTFRRRVNEYIALRRDARLATLRQDTPAAKLEEMEREVAARRGDIDQECQIAVSVIRSQRGALDEITPEELENDPGLREEVERIRMALERIDVDIPRLRAANEDLQASVDFLTRELREQIEGKYVFVGFAATALGDIVSTPIDPQTNGVMCHAQVLNSFLQNRFIARAGRFTEIVICLVLGIVVAVMTSVRGPKFALLATMGLIVAYALFNAYVVFMKLHLWLALAAVLITMAVTWAIVTLFRQLIAEREKRFFSKQLSQYTSPAIAAKIAESPEAARAFKTVQTREVTCFFSDLQGFTTISEQQDAEVVQHVLNAYLDRMSQAIWSQHGLVNKFMGDGIMAFFNSSVDPLPQHPRVACETSLITLDELERLKAEQEGLPASPVFAKLHMRVGVATGSCKNGDMGSDLKADYTVIGDVVNLAARLEPANKVFGTQIMVSGPTREAVKELYEFRYLAELQVKGKARTVPAYELICRKGELSDDQRAYVERFQAGVELYKQRRWDECIVHFTRILARKFDDLGASRYIDACQELKTFPPDDDWNGALELKEK